MRELAFQRVETIIRTKMRGDHTVDLVRGRHIRECMRVCLLLGDTYSSLNAEG